MSNHVQKIEEEVKAMDTIRLENADYLDNTDFQDSQARLIGLIFHNSSLVEESLCCLALEGSETAQSFISKSIMDNYVCRTTGLALFS